MTDFNIEQKLNDFSISITEAVQTIIQYHQAGMLNDGDVEYAFDLVKGLDAQLWEITE
jgi:hypothetical protein